METLYRKYRSQSFAQLVGQEQVVQILRNSIRRGRLGHAYLFCGPRGTGKTSVARIFAKALSCLNPQDGDCCAQCHNCLTIAAGTALDVQEIDAASKNKVDDIRELRDRVGYAPAVFPYKIYIIDEVHMVTTAGFNALLKTLEEPPAHVKFLLCTTEAHKLPLTILSRCLRLDFTRIALPKLAAHLQWMAEAEGFALDHDAALELAKLAEGSARDAISLLDQLVVFCEKSISRSDVRDLFQLGDPAVILDVADAMASSDKRALLDVWERLANQGADAGRFLLQIADELKRRYLDSGNSAWGRALESIWEGLNLLKQESFTGLLVELSLLQAAEAFANPSAGVPLLQTSSSDFESLGVSRAPSTPASPKPEFLRSRVRPDGQGQPSKPAAELPLAAPVVRQPSVRRATPNSASKLPATSDADPKWVDYLEALRRLSLRSYALVYRNAAATVNSGRLNLVFDGKQPWASQACAFAQYPENLEALAIIAGQVYNVPVVAIGLAGEQQNWKLWPPAQPEPPVPPLSQKARTDSKPRRLVTEVSFVAEELETAPLGADLFVDAGTDAQSDPLNPSQLVATAALLESQLDNAAPSTPPTIAEAMEIFEAIPLPDEH